MIAARIHAFGPPGVIVIDELPKPAPPPGYVLVRVSHAGVGPWDALIREGHSVVTPTLPLTLGSDLAGSVEAVGADVSQFQTGDHVFGVTNPQFIGAYAQFALAQANMLAPKPAALDFPQAASVPVVAVTAWQMLFDYAQAQPGQSVLVLGGAGSVGSYAVQLAAQAGLQVFATASATDFQYVRSRGAHTVIDRHEARLTEQLPPLDIVLDTVGGDPQQRSQTLLKPNGILVSVVSPPPQLPDVRSVFFLVEVTTARLNTLAQLFASNKLSPRVGTVLPLHDVRLAHHMLAGAPHQPGKIVLATPPLA